MKICEIFSSIEGEGKRAGAQCTFIRLVGCNLRCSYCDTQYSYTGGFEMPVEQIVEEVIDNGNRLVTITGGEPLIHPHINELISQLTHRRFEVNVETNGSVPIMRFPGGHHLFHTIDFKCFSSGQTDKMLLENFWLATSDDVYKFVVADSHDLDQAYDILKANPTKAQLYFSPVWGKMDPREIVKYISYNPFLKIKDVKVQIQLHKVIWPAEMRGV